MAKGSQELGLSRTLVLSPALGRCKRPPGITKVGLRYSHTSPITHLEKIPLPSAGFPGRTWGLHLPALLAQWWSPNPAFNPGFCQKYFQKSSNEESWLFSAQSEAAKLRITKINSTNEQKNPWLWMCPVVVTTLYWLGWTGLLSNYVTQWCSQNVGKSSKLELQGWLLNKVLALGFPLINHNNVVERTHWEHFGFFPPFCRSWVAEELAQPADHHGCSMNYKELNFQTPGTSLSGVTLQALGESILIMKTLKITDLYRSNKLSHLQWR